MAARRTSKIYTNAVIYSKLKTIGYEASLQNESLRGILQLCNNERDKINKICGMQKYPLINIGEIVECIGGIIIYDDELDYQFYGSVGRNRNAPHQYVLRVNSKFGKYTKRLIIAHMLGHMVNDNVILNDPKMHFVEHCHPNNINYAASELEANKFAMEMLMPKYMIENIIKSIDSSEFGLRAIITAMCTKFDLPSHIVAQRLYNLGFSTLI